MCFTENVLLLALSHTLTHTHTHTHTKPLIGREKKVNLAALSNAAWSILTLLNPALAARFALSLFASSLPLVK